MYIFVNNQKLLLGVFFVPDPVFTTYGAQRGAGSTLDNWRGFLDFSINMSTEGEGSESVAAGSANGAGNVEGIRMLKAVRGGNRAIVTKIQREACSIISDGRDISTDNELSTRLISMADTLKEKDHSLKV